MLLVLEGLGVVLVLGAAFFLKRRSQAPSRDHSAAAAPEPEPDMDIAAGSRPSHVYSSQNTQTPLHFGRWRLVQRLGRGGTSVVYRGVDIHAADTLEASVAIKIFESKMTQNASFRRRFEREVKACQALQHPSMVSLLEAGERDGRMFMVLEFLQGKSLRTHLTSDEGVSLVQFLAWMLPLMEGVAFAHSRGIVHRDLKPENIIVEDRGRIKILDFGMAHGSELAAITAPGHVIGTIAYIPTERMKGISDDPRSDQYALGVMAYEMLAGRRPFVDGLSVPPYMQGEPPALEELRPDLPPDVADVVMRMMDRDIESRYPSVQAALKALVAACGT